MNNIVILGIVSFLTDISTEMVYPIIPLFLARLGAAPAVIGVIEGIAESLASLMKVFSGAACDKYRKKKPVAFAGYAASAINKFLLIFSASWPGVLAARIVDRFGKGVRTAPRDVLISESARDGQMGRAFGLHKMMDMLGSAAGILISYFIVLNMGLSTAADYRNIFWISLIPAALGALTVLFVREKKMAACETGKLRFKWQALDKRLRAFLIIAFLFTLGNSSNVFLLLRAKEQGFSEENVILLYFLFNITASLLAYPFGRLSDKTGRRRVLVAGYLIYGLVYAGFAFVRGTGGMILLFAAYGMYTALTAGVERALVAEIAPPEVKGTMLGLHATLIGLGLLPASVFAGLLWQLSPSAPFWLGSITGILAAIALAILLKNKKHVEN